jgi:hypothetical protein
MSARWCIIFQQASQFPVQDLAHRVVSTLDTLPRS